MTITQDNTGLNLYIDAQKVGSASWSGAPDQVGSSEPLRLGLIQSNHPTARPVALDGTLDDLAIYNRVLSQAEITQLFQAQQ